MKGPASEKVGPETQLNSRYLDSELLVPMAIFHYASIQGKRPPDPHQSPSTLTEEPKASYCSPTCPGGVIHLGASHTFLSDLDRIGEGMCGCHQHATPLWTIDHFVQRRKALLFNHLCDLADLLPAAEREHHVAVNITAVQIPVIGVWQPD